MSTHSSGNSGRRGLITSKSEKFGSAGSSSHSSSSSSKEFLMNRAASARKLGKGATHAVSGSAEFLLSRTGKSARKLGKLGKDVLLHNHHKGSKHDRNDDHRRHDHDDHHNVNDDDDIISTSFQEDEANFRWSIRPDSKLLASQRGEQHTSSDEDDDDDYHLHDDDDDSDIISRSKRGGGSAELGTISEDEDNLTVATAETNDTAGTGGKIKKKKKKKKPKADASPKRKLKRVQSEKPSSGKSKSSLMDDDDQPKRGLVSRSKSARGSRREPRRGGLKKSKSSESDAGGTLYRDDDDYDEIEVPIRSTLKKTKSKKLKKGRSKSPMKIDFTGQVKDATDDDENDEVEASDSFDVIPPPKKSSKQSRKKLTDDDDSNSNSDSDSFISPITRANQVAASLSGRSTGTPLGGIDERTSLDTFLMNGHNKHIMGEEDDSSGRRSRLSISRHSIQSRMSSRASTRPSLANKLRLSIFSETGSFMEEMSSVGGDDEQSRRESLEDEKERVTKLLDELESYEKELSQEHAVLELEREALEFELDKQSKKNQELEATIEELKAKIDELESALKSQEDDQMLMVENEVLRKRLEQKEEAMMSMTSMQSLNMSSNFNMSSSGFHNSSSGLGGGYRSSAVFLGGDPSMSSMQLPMVGEESDDDEGLNHYMSDDSGDELFEKPSAKLQGDLLQARGKLAEKDRIIHAQAEEIKSLQRECEDYKDDEAREKMKTYIKGLEEEKKFFIAEIAKLKAANEKTIVEEMARLNTANEKATMAMNNSSHHNSMTTLTLNSSSSQLSKPFTITSSQRPSMMSALTDPSSQHTSYTFDDEMSREDSNIRGSFATTTSSSQHRQPSEFNRRQSGSAWRSFSTRLFGGDNTNVQEEESESAQVQKEAEQRLDDLLDF